MKNMLYHCTDDVERLQKVIADTEQQFADYLQQIKTLGEEKERRQKELEDLRGAAKKLVDMVDPPEEGEANERPLLERLLGAPQKVVKFLTEAPVACVSHALAFVKSFWPEAQLEMFGQGVAAECTEEQFNEYLQEAQPVDSHQYMGETAWRHCEEPNHIKAPTSKRLRWRYGDEAVSWDVRLLAKELVVLASPHKVLSTGYCGGPTETSSVCFPHQLS
jgi:hypothetical protein